MTGWGALSPYEAVGKMRRAFITGTAGFIGFHLAELLLQEGWEVAGYDGMTDYYDVALKRAPRPAAPARALHRDRGDARGCGRALSSRRGEVARPM
jgi:nucleoside-diphosphate-sugar epimerase